MKYNKRKWRTYRSSYHSRCGYPFHADMTPNARKRLCYAHLRQRMAGELKPYFTRPRWDSINNILRGSDGHAIRVNKDPDGHLCVDVYRIMTTNDWDRDVIHQLKQRTLIA